MTEFYPHACPTIWGAFLKCYWECKSGFESVLLFTARELIDDGRGKAHPCQSLAGLLYPPGCFKTTSQLSLQPVIQDFRSTAFILQNGATTVLWRVLAVQKKISQIPLGLSGDVFTGNSALCGFQTLVLWYVVREGGKKRPDPPKCLGFQARKWYLRSCLTSHPQGAWGCDGECLWGKKQLPRGILVIRVLGTPWHQWGNGPTQRWEEDWQVSPGFAAKMGPICFTQCIPSTMVKFLSIPLELLLSAYQFYLFLLMKQMMNLDTLNWVGAIPETVGNSWLEKPCITVPQWMHTKGRTSRGRGLFSVVCGCVHGSKRHELKLLYDSWDLPTRGSHAGQLILWKQNTAEGIQGHSHSNFIISVSTKVRHGALKQSLHGVTAHGCMQVAWLPLPWDNDGQFSPPLWAVVKTQPHRHLLVTWLLQYRIVFHCKKQI